MAYTFEQVFAADPSNPANVARNATVTIFAPGDVAQTPLTLTTPNGDPLTNPLQVNANGFGSAFMHATLDRVAWAGGNFTGFFTSYEGMKAEAVSARDAANASATAAATSASLVSAPADTAVQTLITTPGTATATALSATYLSGKTSKLKPVADREDALWLSSGARWGVASPHAQDRQASLTPTMTWEGNTAPGNGTGTVQEANTYYDSVMGLWCISYSGAHGVEQQGFATGPTPNGPWTKDGPYIGMGLGGEAVAICHTNVHVENGTVYLFYPSSAGNPGGPLKMVSWPLGQHPAGNLTAPQTIFTPTGVAASGVANTSILKDDDGTYVLAFEYWSGTNAGWWNIGYATSTALLGPYTQQVAPWSTLQRAAGAMFGGPRLMKEDGLYVMLYHAASVPAQPNATVVILPTDVYRATNTSLADTWVQDDAPLIARVTLEEGDQCADVRLITGPGGRQRWLTFTQYDNQTNSRARVGIIPFSPTLLTWDGENYRKVGASATALTRPYASAMPALLNWTAGSDTLLPTTSTAFAAVHTNPNLCSVRFPAPQSRRAMIRVTVTVIVGPGTSLEMNMRESGADIAGTAVRVLKNNGTVDIEQRVTLDFPVTPVLPNSSHTYTLGFARKVGTGTAQVAVGPTYGPLVMSAGV